MTKLTNAVKAGTGKAPPARRNGQTAGQSPRASNRPASAGQGSKVRDERTPVERRGGNTSGGSPAVAKPRLPASAEGLLCLEASVHSRGSYVPCGKPATLIIRNSDPKQYPMCTMCADHNLRNRGATIVRDDEKYELFVPPTLIVPTDHVGGLAAIDRAEAWPTEGQVDAAVQRAVNATQVDEGKLALYVVDGMSKFKARLAADLGVMVDGQRPAADLAQSFVIARQIKESVAEALKIASDACERLAKEVIPQRFEQDQIKSFTTTNGYRVTTSSKFMASIISDFKAEAHQWLRDNKLGDLIVPTVNAGTLSASGKEMLKEGRELPEALFRTYYEPNTSLTKTTKKDDGK